MSISDPGLILKIEGALAKLDDANDKLCAVYTDPLVADVDLVQLTRSLNHIAQAKLRASATLE